MRRTVTLMAPNGGVKVVGARAGQHVQELASHLCGAAEDVPEEDQFGRVAYLQKCQELGVSPVSQVRAPVGQARAAQPSKRPTTEGGQGHAS